MPTTIGGTFVVGVTTTPDPASTAIRAHDLDGDPASTLARLHAWCIGYQGLRAGLVARLGLTDSRFRRHLEALEAARYAVRERFHIDGGWAYVIAVTDTPGLLPDRDQLREAFVNGVASWVHPLDPPARLPIPRSDVQSRFTQPAVTWGDLGKAQVGTSSQNSHVNRFPLTSSPPAAQQRGGATGEPVNRLSPVVPESSEVREHANTTAANRSVVASVTELEALAKMRGVRPVDGGKFRQSREVLAASRTLDQNVVDDGLALLARLRLPFWVAPETWALLGRGWTPDQVATLLEGVHEAKSAHSAACWRMARALEGPAAGGGRTDSAEVDEAPAGEELAPASVAGLIERDAHVTGTWEDQARSWAEETQTAVDDDAVAGTAPWDQRRGFGWRAPATPQIPAWNRRARELDAIRSESGGGVTTESQKVDKLAEMRAVLAGRRRGAGVTVDA